MPWPSSTKEKSHSLSNVSICFQSGVVVVRWNEILLPSTCPCFGGTAAADSGNASAADSNSAAAADSGDAVAVVFCPDCAGLAEEAVVFELPVLSAVSCFVPLHDVKHPAVINVAASRISVIMVFDL